MIPAALAPALALLVPQSADTGSASVTIAAPAPPQVDATTSATTGLSAERPVSRRRPRHAPGDPFEGANRYFYRQHMKFDRALLRPAALAYKHGVPKPVRAGLRHFFNNLREPFIFVNFLLQLKPGKAAETLGRFLINSTLGLGGVLDVANEPNIHLPHRPNGFGDTLGYYGVKPGPYLFIPLFGPTTLRDLIGSAGEGLTLPKLSITPFDTPQYQVTRNVTSGLDRRAQADDDLHALLKDAVDPYATFRSAYLQDRAGEIDALRGRSTAATSAPELSDPLTDPAGTTAKSAPPSTAPELRDPLTDPAPASGPPTAPDPAQAQGASSAIPSPAKARAQ